MINKKIVTIGIACLMLASIGAAAAKNAAGGDSISTLPQSTLLTQKCWTLDPFIDTLKLTISSGGQNFLLDGTDGASGFYVLDGAGNLHKESDGLFHWGVSFVNPTGFFGGATDVAFFGTLNPGSLTGTWNLKGIDSGFLNSGTLSPVACPPGPFSTGVSGNAAGK